MPVAKTKATPSASSPATVRVLSSAHVSWACVNNDNFHQGRSEDLAFGAVFFRLLFDPFALVVVS